MKKITDSTLNLQLSRVSLCNAIVLKCIVLKITCCTHFQSCSAELVADCLKCCTEDSDDATSKVHKIL